LDCKKAENLLEGYADRELDPVHSLEIEEHLRACAACSQRHEGTRLLRSGLRRPGLYFNAPADLQAKLRSSLRKGTRVETARRPRSWSWLKAAAPAALAAMAILIAIPFLRGPSEDEIVRRDVISSHVRSLMADHLADVASSDEHTVKPWFAGKLDFSPVVVDLKADGFPLIGGRLDYIGNKAVAALIYRREKHFINLFIWPSDSVETSGTETMSRQGYNIFRWNEAGMTYWAISDLNRAELEEFTRKIQAHL
jgi:anti-sigma factor RsiW